MKAAIFNVEISKIKTNLIPRIFLPLFQFHENTLIKKFNLNLRNFRELLTHDKKTPNYGIRNCIIEHHFFRLVCHVNVKIQHL